MKNAGDMVSYKSWLSASVMACFALQILLVSCNGGEGNEADTAEVDSTIVINDAEVQEIQVFYQIPSPDEMIAFIKQGGFEYDNEFLNPVDNVNKHVDQKAQALNLGIYTADLTYMASYGAFQESIKYFNAIMKLSDGLGISSAFDEGLVSRVKNNLKNTDSLEIITRKSYYSIVDNLEQSQRGKTLSIVAAGGWLESVFIVVNLMEEFNPDNSIVQRLADQKLVIENLMMYMHKYESDPSVKSTIKDFEKLNQLYEDLEETPTSTKLKEEKGSKMIIGGEGSIKITEKHYNALRDEVIRLRNSFASLNS